MLRYLSILFGVRGVVGQGEQLRAHVTVMHAVRIISAPTLSRLFLF